MPASPRSSPWMSLIEPIAAMPPVRSANMHAARTFGRTSIEWAQRTETQTQGQRSLNKVIPLQGGVPIKVGEETIGGVGLSGAPNGGPQEEACGKAGIAKVADQLK